MSRAVPEGGLMGDASSPKARASCSPSSGGLQELGEWEHPLDVVGFILMPWQSAVMCDPPSEVVMKTDYLQT